ncbi:MAG: NUDIX hydrolase [archaeon GW2011_AR5]|nr:MAG: NUDIX hydrolase [archaeon GW2011_AR5]
MEIDKLAWILIKDRKVLSTISKGKDTYYIPGGKREKGETDGQALIREIKEELSVDIIPPTIKLYGTFMAQAHGKAEGVIVKMTCYTAEFEGEMKPSAEVERIVWITSGDADSERSSPVDRLILADLKTKNLID